MLAMTRDCCMLDEGRQRAVGAVALMLAGDAAWRGDMGKLLADEIVPAYRHGKLAFFLGYDRVPMGFVTWAHLSEETEARLLSTLDPWLHISEWNEGPSLWIRCLYLPQALRCEGVALCLSQLFPHVESARVLLRRKTAMTALELDRDFVSRWACL